MILRCNIVGDRARRNRTVKPRDSHRILIPCLVPTGNALSGPNGGRPEGLPHFRCHLKGGAHRSRTEPLANAHWSLNASPVPTGKALLVFDTAFSLIGPTVRVSDRPAIPFFMPISNTKPTLVAAFLRPGFQRSYTTAYGATVAGSPIPVSAGEAQWLGREDRAVCDAESLHRRRDRRRSFPPIPRCTRLHRAF